MLLIINDCDQVISIIISIHTIKADFNLFIICSYNDIIIRGRSQKLLYVAETYNL